MVSLTPIMAQLSQNKQAPGGHKSSATKIVHKAEVILAGSNPDTTRLAQIKMSLREKTGIWRQLDVKILNLVNYDATAEEIEQVDFF